MNQLIRRPNQIPFKVYAVHNPFNRKDKITYLSGIIRVGTNSHWNHTAVELEVDGVYWILEAVGRGVILTKREDWLAYTDREVLVRVHKNLEYLDLNKVLPEIGTRYGYLDLYYTAKYIIRRRMFSLEEEWDGMCPWEGWFCSELAAYLLGFEKPWLFLPSDFETIPYFYTESRYKTKRGVGIVEYVDNEPISRF